MDAILLLFVTVLCFWVGIKSYYKEDQCKIFQKWPLRLKDVKQYNHFCGILIMAFGAVAVITMLVCSYIGGIVGDILILVIIPEALVLMKIYRKGEKEMTVEK